MVNDILQKIGEHIAAKNTGYNAYFTGGIQLEDGRIAKFTAGEGEYQGLMDTQGDYFYIRYMGDINSTPVSADDKMVSCPEYNIEAPLRLVSWYKNGIDDAIAKTLSFDLSHFKLSGLQYYYMEPLEITKVTIHPEKVYMEESKKDKPDMQHRVSLIAIDFTLRCRYVLKDDCADREFCESTC